MLWGPQTVLPGGTSPQNSSGPGVVGLECPYWGCHAPSDPGAIHPGDVRGCLRRNPCCQRAQLAREACSSLPIQGSCLTSGLLGAHAGGPRDETARAVVSRISLQMDCTPGRVELAGVGTERSLSALGLRPPGRPLPSARCSQAPHYLPEFLPRDVGRLQRAVPGDSASSPLPLAWVF